MRKYSMALIALFIAGAVLSGILLVDHYHPGIQERIVSCGDDLDNPCRALGLSPYSVLFGAPVALYGLYFYLFMLFTLLAADYSGGRYRGDAVAVLLPAAILALIADVVLAALLIKTGLFCKLCIATYAINILAAAVLFVLLGQIGRDGETGFRGIYRGLLGMPRTPDGRAVFSLFILFGFLLFVALFSAGGMMKANAGRARIPAREIAAHVNDFYSTPVEVHGLPESPLTLGDGELGISVFTDFLCGACYQLYQVEKELFARHRGRIRMAYYHYPLDGLCNPDVKSTRYPGSCVASRAMIAASRLGIFREYFLAHFGDFERIRHGYTRETASGTAARLIDADDFVREMESPETDAMLSRDTALAARLGIRATPTIIIGGRKIEGTPPAEILSAIVRRELERGRPDGKPRQSMSKGSTSISR